MRLFVCRLVLASVALLPTVLPAGADDAWPPTALQALPASLPAQLRQMTDVGGLRSQLENEGVKFTFSYYADAFDNPIGGIRQGPGYDGRFGVIIDADLQKLAGWTGATFHASVHQIHGTQFSATHLDNLMLVSGVEAPTSTRLFNLWIEQEFGQRLSVRFGQFTAGQEFLVSDNADLFVNSTFGWPTLNAIDLPSGGPAFPEATPGVRLQIAATKELVFRAAIFDGNPAGPGIGNPVLRDPYGVAFRVSDPPFLIAEVAYDHDQEQVGKTDQNQEG
jgi:porin